MRGSADASSEHEPGPGSVLKNARIGPKLTPHAHVKPSSTACTDARERVERQHANASGSLADRIARTSGDQVADKTESNEQKERDSSAKRAAVTRRKIDVY